MIGWLIFSINSIVDLALNQVSLTNSLIICFESSYEFFKVMAKTSALSIFLAKEVSTGFKYIL